MPFKINDKHIETDLGLACINILIETPEVQTNFVDIPGRNGSLDLTESLGAVFFNDRVLSMNTYFKDCDITDETTWFTKYSEIANSYHGQTAKIVFDDNPSYYYKGRCSITPVNISGVLKGIDFEVMSNPFKYPLTSSIEDWLWDPFNFETDVIREYGDIKVNGIKEVVVIGSAVTETPTITVSDDMTVTIEGKTIELQAGINRSPYISVGPGEHVFKFVGNGTVSIELKGGML